MNSSLSSISRFDLDGSEHVLAHDVAGALGVHAAVVAAVARSRPELVRPARMGKRGRPPLVVSVRDLPALVRYLDPSAVEAAEALAATPNEDANR